MAEESRAALSDEWLEYKKLTEQIERSVTGTQKRLKELEQTSAVKLLSRAEGEKDESSESNLHDATWKPINERLAEEIKKQRDLLKPRRPPPPPSTAVAEQQSSKSFVEQPTSSQRNMPSWDDEHSVDYYAAVPSYQQPALVESSECAQLENAEDNASSQSPALKKNNIPSTTEDHEVVSTSSDEEHAKSGHLYQWTAFSTLDQLPQSESGFFSNRLQQDSGSVADPFAPSQSSAMGKLEDDPFEVFDAEHIVKTAKQGAQMEQELKEDLSFFGAQRIRASKVVSDGFEDDFVTNGRRKSSGRSISPPLFEEDDSEPLENFYEAQDVKAEWELYIRYPIKKRLVGERSWKLVFVKLINNKVLQVFHNKNEQTAFQEFSLQPTYCLTPVCLQQYDAFGKIHATRLQHAVYKERVGLRPGQIPRLVEGQLNKLGMPLEHAAQMVHLIKFGSLDTNLLNSFVWCIEDALFKLPAKRMQPSVYRQDEVQIHCYDEYIAQVSAVGLIKSQKARVHIYCLAFLNGMPLVEIGLNDRRRQGMEVVRRKDIMPMHTERWIRYEDCEFHSSVDVDVYNKEHVIRLQPLDACFAEVFRFRVRPPKQRQLPLHITAVMKIVGSKIEIRIECMVAGYSSRKAGQVPCEDIQIRFPIPEAWIYIFREERYWGYGSVHAKVRRPGKVKNIRDKFMGIVQPLDGSLMEVAIGDAKYEHVYRAIVWRIPRLPEKNHEAYKTHLFKCQFELSSFDMMPEAFVPMCEVEFTMPIATVSNTVVRSVSVEQHEDPEHIEKWVRYLSKYSYTVDIDYIQSSVEDTEAVADQSMTNREEDSQSPVKAHQPEIDINVAKNVHEGYQIQVDPETKSEGKIDSDGDESSNEEEQETDNFPMVQINAVDYSY